MNPIRSLCFTFLCLAALPGTAATYSSSELFLRAWYPELGDSGDAAAAEDKTLSAAALDARLGRFRSAQRQLASLPIRQLADANSGERPSTTILAYKAAAFQRELLQFRGWPIGGGFVIEGESGLRNVEINPQFQQFTEEIGSLRSTAGAAAAAEIDEAEKYVKFTWECFQAEPLNFRYDQLSKENANLPRSPASSKACDDMEKSLSLEAVSPVTMRLLLLDRRYRRTAAAWEFPAAKAAAEEAVQVADSAGLASAAAIWRRYRGDLAAAPYGSPLTLGIDVASQFAVRGTNSVPVFSRTIVPPGPNEIAEARRWYDQVQGETAEVLLRRAYLESLEHGPDVAPPAFEKAAEAASREHAPRLEGLSRATAGLFAAKSSEYEAALKLLDTEQDFGCTQSLALVAATLVSRYTQFTSPLRSIRFADTAAPALFKLQHRRAAADVFAAAKIAEYGLGREDSFLYYLSNEIQALLAWIRHADEVLPKYGLGADGEKGSHVLYDGYRVVQGLYTVGSHYWQLYQMEGLNDWLQLERGAKALLTQFVDRYKIDPQVLKNYEAGKTQFTEAASRLQDISMGDCSMWVSQYRSLPSKIDNVDLWAEVASHAAECNQEARRDVFAALRDSNLVAKAQEAVTQWKTKTGEGSELAMHSALDRLDKELSLAFRLRDTEGLERRSQDTCALIRNNPDVLLSVSYQPHCDLYRAWALLLQNKPAAAAGLLNSIASVQYWLYGAEPRFRQAVAAAAAYASAMLNDSAGALLNLEWLRRESQRAERIKTGIDPEALRTTKLATLLRDAALGRSTPGDDQSILDLRSQNHLASSAESTKPAIEDIRRAMAAIPSDTVLLIFLPLPTQDGFIVWRMETAGSIPGAAAGPVAKVSIIPCPMYQFNRAAKTLLALVVNREGGWMSPSQQLYKFLFSRLDPIPPGKTLAIWLAGSQPIPFELLGPDPERIFLRSNPIVYLTDLAATPMPAQKPARRAAVLITHPGEALTGVARESREIARILQLPEQSVLDPSAAEAPTILSGSRIVHIAAHSVIDQRNPLRSYIALRDGHLEAWQLLGGGQNADLIVLSACSTRRGAERVLSDDSTSISSLVELGGARTVLSSLGPADDGRSADLMIDFYDLLNGRPALALFQARQRSLARHLNPVQVANFVLSARDVESLGVSFPSAQNK